MSHEINLEKYQIRTDLAFENNKKFSKQKEEKIENINVITIDLNDNEARIINKKKGKYITIKFDDVTDIENSNKLKEVFSKQIEIILKYLKIKKNDTCLVIGLGNNDSTPDALGPKVIDNILVTRHLFVLSSVEDGYRCVSAIKPGVMGTTGLEASDILKGLIEIYKFDFIIAIDALASSSTSRVNKTIQITTAGINPGSGIGNNRKEISSDTLGIPVIAVGVPTVVDAATIVVDTINYMYKKYAYEKQNINNASRRLSVGNINYLKKDIKVNEKDKKDLFGIIGNLDNEEVYSLINEVLTPTGYNLMVTPKDINFQIDKLSLVISEGINNALHDKLKEF